MQTPQIEEVLAAVCSLDFARPEDAVASVRVGKCLLLPATRSPSQVERSTMRRTHRCRLWEVSPGDEAAGSPSPGSAPTFFYSTPFLQRSWEMCRNLTDCPDSGMLA